MGRPEVVCSTCLPLRGKANPGHYAGLFCMLLLRSKSNWLEQILHLCRNAQEFLHLLDGEEMTWPDAISSTCLPLRGRPTQIVDTM